MVEHPGTQGVSLVAQAIEKRAAFEKAKIEFEQIKTSLRELASETGATFVSSDGIVVVSPIAAPTPRINIPAVILHYGLEELGENGLLNVLRARKQTCRIISAATAPIRFCDQESE